MQEAVGVGVCIILGLIIAVAVIAVVQDAARREESRNATTGGLAPLAVLADIAEEVHRHGKREHVLPWAISPASSPVRAHADSHKRTTLEELSERIHVIEARLDRMTVELKVRTRPFAALQ